MQRLKDVCRTVTGKDNILYHYTDYLAFHGILKDRELRVNNVRNMNDAAEMQLFMNGIFRAVEQRLEEEQADEKLGKLRDLAKELNKKYFDYAAYAACFSTYRDDASQWERYANRGKGVCLGIDRSVLERMTGDKIALSGKGGATSGDGLKWLEDYYFDTHSVEYLVIAFGMNDRDYDTWLSNMKQMITLAKKNGATPILMTIPPRGHAQLDQVHKRMSQWVRSSGYAYLDYEYLMTVGHDRCTKNPSMYLSDGLHPVAAVHKSIAQQLYNIVY